MKWPVWYRFISQVLIINTFKGVIQCPINESHVKHWNPDYLAQEINVSSHQHHAVHYLLHQWKAACSAVSQKQKPPCYPLWSSSCTWELDGSYIILSTSVFYRRRPCRWRGQGFGVQSVGLSLTASASCAWNCRRWKEMCFIAFVLLWRDSEMKPQQPGQAPDSPRSSVF